MMIWGFLAGKAMAELVLNFGTIESKTSVRRESTDDMRVWWREKLPWRWTIAVGMRVWWEKKLPWGREKLSMSREKAKKKLS